MVIELTEQELLSRTHNFEDHFVERKTSGDLKDCLKTVVGFANTAPDGYPCVLFIGVKNGGEIETPQVNLDTLQKTLNRELQKAYPAVTYLPRIIGERGLQALAVVVFGSEQRPHFTGPSYICKGSETFEASEGEFLELIAKRNSKANKILSYKNMAVTVVNRQMVQNQAAYETIWNDKTVGRGMQSVLGYA